jgi:hypothetical protein
LIFNDNQHALSVEAPQALNISGHIKTKGKRHPRCASQRYDNLENFILAVIATRCARPDGTALAATARPASIFAILAGAGSR